MNKKIGKRLILSALCIALTSFEVRPVSRTELVMGTIASGCISALALGKLAYHCSCYFDRDENQLLWGKIGFVVGALIGGKLLFDRTPTKRLSNVQKIVDDSKRSLLVRLVRSKYQDDNAFFKSLDELYISSAYPRMQALDHLIDYQRNLHKVRDLCARVHDELKDKELIAECLACDTQAQEMITHVSPAIAKIKAMPDYVQRRRAYEEAIAAEALRRQLAWESFRHSMDMLNLAASRMNQYHTVHVYQHKRS